MCGIFGTTYDSPDVEAIVRRALAIQGRGSDGEGIWRGGGVTFGHRRLAIIDPDARSAQPMVRGGIVLSYNGELWNYRELRSRLASMGAKFSTESDTEVVVQAYRFLGERFYEAFDGMFSIALWDGAFRRLTLVKDRFGKTPLAVAREGGDVWFASEAKALVFGVGIPMSDIEELPPAIARTYEVRSDGQVRLVEDRTWWRLEVGKSGDGAEAAAEKIGKLLGEAVAARTVSDVPICTLLSGGLDSLSITGLLARTSPGRVTAFTAVLDRKSEDLLAAREAAKEIGVELVEVPLRLKGANDLRRRAAESIWRSELSSQAQVEIGIACLALAREISDRGFKVVFSGEGSDELWGSYGMMRRFSKGADWAERRRNRVVGQWRLNFPRCNKVFLSHGVECRLPFLSKGLVEYGLSLRREAIEPGGVWKGALIEAMAARGLPRKLLERKKLAFQTGMGLREACGDIGLGAPAYRTMRKRMFEGQDLSPLGRRVRLEGHGRHRGRP